MLILKSNSVVKRIPDMNRDILVINHLIEKKLPYYVTFFRLMYANLIHINFFSVHKKLNFPLSISSVNVTKSAASGRFGHIYWKNSLMENFIFCGVFVPWIAQVIALRQLKLHWQKLKDEYLRPGFISIPPYCMSKFETQKRRNITIFTIFGSLVIKHR